MITHSHELVVCENSPHTIRYRAARYSLVPGVMIRANPVLHGYTIFMLFANRSDAGKQLVHLLLPYEKDHPIILAIPRGGVVVGYEIAKALESPFDVLISRKIGAPGNPEFGIGAIAENNTVILDDTTIDRLQISQETIRAIQASEKQELERRKKLYRQGRRLPILKNKTVILVDDGLATGVTAQAAIAAVKKHNPKKVVLAAPVCGYEATKTIETEIHSLLCLETPFSLQAIGTYYKDFSQVSDDDVMKLLQTIKKCLLIKISS